MSTDSARDLVVAPEHITITQSGIEKSLKLQDQQAKQRHDYDIAVQEFKRKQSRYQEYIKKRKELLALETELQIVDKPVPVPVKKAPTRKHYTLQDGTWQEVEGIIEAE